MDSAGRLVIIFGVTVVVLGLLMLGASRLGFGRLPGDIALQDGFIERVGGSREGKHADG